MYFKETMYLNYSRASKGLPGISKGPLGVKPSELSTYPSARSTENRNLGYVFLGCISRKFVVDHGFIIESQYYLKMYKLPRHWMLP